MLVRKIRCIVGLPHRESAMYVEVLPSSIPKLKAQKMWVLVDPDDERDADLWSVYHEDVWKPRR